MHAPNLTRPRTGGLPAEALADYQGGMPIGELLRKHGMNPGTFYRHLEARGIARRYNFGGNRLVLPPEDVAAYVAGRENGITLAAKHGTAATLIYRALHRAGAPVRSVGAPLGSRQRDDSRLRKVTQAQERKILRLLEDGLTQREVARRFGITRQRVGQLAARTNR